MLGLLACFRFTTRSAVVQLTLGGCDGKQDRTPPRSSLRVGVLVCWCVGVLVCVGFRSEKRGTNACKQCLQAKKKQKKKKNKKRKSAFFFFFFQRREKLDGWSRTAALFLGLICVAAARTLIFFRGLWLGDVFLLLDKLMLGYL